jgi:hypothetical protein
MDLQKRIEELEAQLETLRKENEELVKEKKNIFYKWTKEDFLQLLEENYGEVSSDIQEKLWKAWIPQFAKQFLFSETYEMMGMILENIAETYGMERQ